MRLAFITGCLEPGRDGVGDYTRTLATECARRGYGVGLLSLGEESRKKNAANDEWPILRLSRADWQADGGEEARRWLDAFQPDWTSLQFVPYSFDPRGLFGAAIPAIAKMMAAARRRQIFFHELWIGSQQGAPLKARAIGWAQRRAVKRLLREIGPTRVHTSTGYYQAALATLGCRAALLPMIGSVPLQVGGAKPEAVAGLNPEALVCGMFGTLHPNWQPGAFLADFAALAAAQGRPAVLLAAGGLGYGAALFERLAVEWRGRVELIAAGRGDEARLARLFARFDFAVTSVPWNMLGKSSSAAALREHGLCVVVTEQGAPARDAAPDESVTDHSEQDVPYFRRRKLPPSILMKRVPAAGVPALAERFLADLHAAF